jgi:predicted nucleotidyltransferase
MKCLELYGETRTMRKKIKTEIRSRLQGRPNLFGVFGFGSFFRSNNFNDVDLLVVVHDLCDWPLKEFYEIKALLDEIGAKFDVPIDITYLSYTEYTRKPLRESDCLVPIVGNKT